MAMKGLGRAFDIAPVITPVNLATGANSGFPVSLENAGGVTFVVFKGVGTAGDDPVLTFREAQDGSGTGEQDLDVVTEWYAKTDTTNHSLSGNETWARNTQTVGGDVDLDAKGGNAEDAAIVCAYIDADDLSDGFTHVTVDIASVGSNAQIGGVLAILHDLKVQRTPANLAATQ